MLCAMPLLQRVTCVRVVAWGGGVCEDAVHGPLKMLSLLTAGE